MHVFPIDKIIHWILSPLSSSRMWLVRKILTYRYYSCLSGEGYIDPRDAGWTNDKSFEPADLNKLSSRNFVIYKFGCFVADLVSTHCTHSPVTLLLADKIPPNPQLAHNAYRNSFKYDAGNRLLYMRTDRLDNVGQFLLVLVHTMAHIKAGKYSTAGNT